jgi:hypothetical protein
MDRVGPTADGPAHGDGGKIVQGGPVLRLYRFRPLKIAFDRTMRDSVLPGLAARPGVLDLCAARKGPDETGIRVVVSLWSSLDAMTEAMGPDLERLRFFPEYMDDTADHHLEVFPVIMAVDKRESLRTGILRIARGELASLPMDRFAEQVRTGIEADSQAGYGPASVVLAANGERAFVTVSCWRDWATLEQATGSSVDHPIHTQRLSDLSSLEVDHLELLPIGP